MEGITWAERIELFRWALLAALLAGAVCPLLGAFLLVRRTSFHGIALPQIATAGVVFGFVAMPWWIEHVGIGGLDLAEATGDSHAAMNYHLAWAAAFTFGGLGALAWLGRRGGSEVGRVAAAFAIASAATVLFGRMSPVGKGFVDELIAGELLGVGVHELETLAAVLGVVLATFLAFRRELLVVSYDRESAQVLGVRVLAIEALLHAITGMTISTGTMFLGPVMLFGLLVLPPMSGRAGARSMAGFLARSSAYGVAAVIAGVVASFELDLPLGASVVAAAAALHVGALVARRLATRGTAV
jgi:zinc transport system permease protein